MITQFEKPAGFNYRAWLHRQEPHRTLRAQLAQSYRAMRADDPRRARLLWSCAQEVGKKVSAQVADALFANSDGPSFFKDFR